VQRGAPGPPRPALCRICTTGWVRVGSGRLVDPGGGRPLLMVALRPAPIAAAAAVVVAVVAVVVAGSVLLIDWRCSVLPPPCRRAPVWGERRPPEVWLASG